MLNPPAKAKPARRRPPKEAFHLVVRCPSERAQRELFEQLIRAGFSCRVLTS